MLLFSPIGECTDQVCLGFLCLGMAVVSVKLRCMLQEWIQDFTDGGTDIDKSRVSGAIFQKFLRCKVAQLPFSFLRISSGIADTTVEV